MRDEILGTGVGALLKSAPPVGVASAVAAGVSLDDVVLVLTIVYLVGQIGYLLWRWIREWRQKVQS